MNSISSKINSQVAGYLGQVGAEFAQAPLDASADSAPSAPVFQQGGALDMSWMYGKGGGAGTNRFGAAAQQPSAQPMRMFGFEVAAGKYETLNFSAETFLGGRPLTASDTMVPQYIQQPKTDPKAGTSVDVRLDEAGDVEDVEGVDDAAAEAGTEKAQAVLDAKAELDKVPTDADEKTKKTATEKYMAALENYDGEFKKLREEQKKNEMELEVATNTKNDKDIVRLKGVAKELQTKVDESAAKLTTKAKEEVDAAKANSAAAAAKKAHLEKAKAVVAAADAGGTSDETSKTAERDALNKAMAEYDPQMAVLLKKRQAAKDAYTTNSTEQNKTKHDVAELEYQRARTLLIAKARAEVADANSPGNQENAKPAPETKENVPAADSEPKASGAQATDTTDAAAEEEDDSPRAQLIRRDLRNFAIFEDADTAAKNAAATADEAADAFYNPTVKFSPKFEKAFCDARDKSNEYANAWKENDAAEKALEVAQKQLEAATNPNEYATALKDLSVAECKVRKTLSALLDAYKGVAIDLNSKDKAVVAWIAQGEEAAKLLEDAMNKAEAKARAAMVVEKGSTAVTTEEVADTDPAKSVTHARSDDEITDDMNQWCHANKESYFWGYCMGNFNAGSGKIVLDLTAVALKEGFYIEKFKTSLANALRDLPPEMILLEMGGMRVSLNEGYTWESLSEAVDSSYAALVKTNNAA